MDCDKCGKPAKVHLTQLVGGQVKKVALCNECAKESGVTDPTGFGLADMLLAGDSGKTPSLVPSQSGASGDDRSCPACGFTLTDLKKVRRLGCATCYSTFREEVKGMIRGMHKGPSHCGKVPEGLVEMHQRETRMKELKTRMEQAIGAENYEEAASLRDEIIKLDKETLKTK